MNFTYQARVVVAGSFTAPPAVALLMYQPEVYGRTQFTSMEISKEKGLSSKILEKNEVSSIISQIKHSSVGNIAKLIFLGIFVGIEIFVIFIGIRRFLPLFRHYWESWRECKNSAKDGRSL